ncbi:MAG: hypothetical protein PHN82_00130 [bacterium]|nr:hypothetical protein [bacterium]
MKRGSGIAAVLVVLSALLAGCTTLDESPLGKGVKTYEKYSDEFGRERDVQLLGKDVVIEPEADKKIRINF